MNANITYICKSHNIYKNFELLKLNENVCVLFRM